MADLSPERYISITTYRRDGSPVTTPVWVVGDGRLLYVWTGADTGKVRRIRANPEVSLAPCTARGKITGSATRALGAIAAVDDRPDVWPLFLAKYGLQVRVLVWTGKIWRTLRRSPSPPFERIYLELTAAP